MTKPLYLLEADFGRLGRAFIETDRDENSREHVIRLIRSGEVKPVKVIEVHEDDGFVRDVTADIIAEAEQPREPASWEEIGNKLTALQDHLRDLRKHEAL